MQRMCQCVCVCVWRGKSRKKVNETQVDGAKRVGEVGPYLLSHPQFVVCAASEDTKQ